MNQSSDNRIVDSFTSALSAAARDEAPYRHWFIENAFPPEILKGLQTFTFPVSDPGGVSGKRELHNDTRCYFDQHNIAAHPTAAAVAHAFQSRQMIQAIEDFFDVSLSGAFLRIEYAQDVTGFWLQPHTDLGVKRLSVLFYLSGGGDYQTLGTDIYDRERVWVKRAAFRPNTATAFVPGDDTFHGFEKRAIGGVRKTLILNYVTAEWRDREQLAFPEMAVSAV